MKLKPFFPLVLIIVIGLAARLFFLAEVSHYSNFRIPYPGLDAALYHGLAQSIAQGDLALGNEVFYYSASYAYFLGALYRFFGESPWVPRLMNILLGIATVSLIYLFTKRLFRSHGIAILAALGAALYGPLLVADTSALKTSFGLFCTALSLYLIGCAQDKERFTPWCLSGIVLGLALNLQGQLTLFVIAISLWLLLRRLPEGLSITDHYLYSLPFRLRRLGGLIVGVILVLSPFAIRNYRVAGELAFMPSDGGIHFFIGNHRGAWGGYSPVPGVRGNPAGHFYDARRYSERKTGRSLTPSEVNAFWKDRAVDFILKEPMAFLQLLGRKVLLLFSPYEIPNNENYQYLEKRSSFLACSLSTSFLLPLGFAGFCLSLPHFKMLAPLQLFLVTYFLGVLFSFVTWRYRLPLALVLWPFAAFLTMETWQALKERRLAIPLVSIFLVYGFYSLGRIWEVSPSMYKTDMQASQNGMAACEEKAFLLANLGAHISLSDPVRSEIWFHLFQLHHREGDTEGGIEILRRALAENPNQPHLWEVLSRVYARMGDPASAQEAALRAKRYLHSLH